MRPIETRYARSGDVRIAYQVVGQGLFDLVFVPGFISNLNLQWEDEGYSRLLKRLSAFSRLILFDKRGTGLSDRVDTHHLPSLETATGRQCSTAARSIPPLSSSRPMRCSRPSRPSRSETIPPGDERRAAL
ncbi:alpha/beta fold hydrolase [Mesorhizobium helmanticense]|uniref:alpha/beta fold hydrolase n=1 Tax=Mesorhizobium helmanticense TaxID=1776423 RepID=UPI001FE1A918|nr:alpha/beta hydrolase [Mesorhizobium helmanticense]